MSKVWITSDWHLGHKAIPKYRHQVVSVEDNTQQLVDNTLSLLRKRDVLWILGDIIFDEAHEWALREVRANIQAIKVVLGNHCTEGSRKDIVKRLLMDGVYDAVHGLVEYKGCWLSHAPLHSDELRGCYNIHGHTHNHHINDSRHFNACVDQTDMKPMLFTEIKEVLCSRSIQTESGT